MMAVKNTKKKRNVVVSTVVYPATLLRPVGNFLANQLKSLKRRRKEITKDDPFKNTGRGDDNASPDTDAEEQYGHARTVAVKSEIDKKIIQTRKAMSRVKLGKYGICEKCGNMIDTDRLTIYPEATMCTKCAKKQEKSVRK